MSDVRTRTAQPIPTVVDAVVIGAGSGGLTAAAGLARFGKQVLLVERDEVGGDCTNVGCIPSKALLHLAKNQGENDPASTLQRVRARRDALRDHETEEFSDTDNVSLCFGRAELVGPGRVAVTTDTETVTIATDHVVIATGSRPVRFPLGPDDGRIVTNDELFELDDAPDKLVIVGGGAVGLEMASAFSDLGSEVTILEGADRIAPTALAQASGVVQRSLEAKGVRIEVSTQASADHPAVRQADRILLAVGRVPNSEGLGLDTVGVETDESGHIEIDDRGRTSVEGVWAAGDVTDRGGTTHAAGAWGRRITKSIIAKVLPTSDLPIETGVIFTDPELATIGSQPEVPADDVRRIVFDLRDADRGFTDEIADGVIIVDVRRLSGTILGATIVGPRAGELISVFALAMHAGLPMHKWAGTVWPYPTYADALGRVVDLYMGELYSEAPANAKAYLRGVVGRLADRVRS